MCLIFRIIEVILFRIIEGALYYLFVLTPSLTWRDGVVGWVERDGGVGREGWRGGWRGMEGWVERDGGVGGEGWRGGWRGMEGWVEREGGWRGRVDGEGGWVERDGGVGGWSWDGDEVGDEMLTQDPTACSPTETLTSGASWSGGTPTPSTP